MLKPLPEVKPALFHAGYLCISETDTRVSMNHGCIETWVDERVYHLHLRHIGDEDEHCFCACLRA